MTTVVSVLHCSLKTLDTRVTVSLAPLLIDAVLLLRRIKAATPLLARPLHRRVQPTTSSSSSSDTLHPRDGRRRRGNSSSSGRLRRHRNGRRVPQMYPDANTNRGAHVHQ